MKAKLGIAPIAWWNDDLAELSDDVSLDECLRQAAEAGLTGMETGRRFPMDMAQLGPILARHGISVCGGWFSGMLLDGDIEAEKDRIAAQHAFFVAAGAPCIVYGEVARSVQGERNTPLSRKPVISEVEMAAYGRKVSDFADWSAKQGMPIAYHHHMAAVVETEAELDLFMKHSSVPLLFDAGHMAFAGGDNLRVIENHHSRIAHVHTKDIRRDVTDGLDRTRESFLDAVIKGAFTVPGDGSLDFEAIVRALAQKGYEGWFVIEAEQDPKVSPPLEMAIKGRAELKRVMDAAGYEVEA
ncbi:myo-inosose-2 dehydratase [Ponticoccus sp. SC2-23]|uniref:myo-inosose-2 dehydratase n=1 Tax=Alexandriicola marinus TaxID=2081710 RepID=UPI000FD7C333|nr:myo-inosose-2 dehydratase [Alexandriicola marinus]MBM1222424.1 myo-inosose-2 dehydratase [Ponticoccus sp. SC6-9]MBM1224537.1 myo-inosose-2 dehydratase [Ponticoccus sp. SC6-15]MBM1229683.1 myo-inosose-2 dehydratase [Ponticoccus sp. SC6-38]MBM1233503.1 myo-inosose-2 dehydratase [Ponticoccus sp. SC6-45]MBM1236547.1 myo-inosose-2 dehydratase [Ponticoccus sp. SC6-49]MBM1244591.1 myo-inosose-2 dehydratase [Ponticoccus sp. SC2-64]MBM1247027.1 myo-inosose-2 dehydratase [Ponticoccus sp. SC6-42]MB